MEFCLNWNNGKFKPLGVSARRLEMARTGHSGEQAIFWYRNKFDLIIVLHGFGPLDKNQNFPWFEHYVPP